MSQRELQHGDACPELRIGCYIERNPSGYFEFDPISRQSQESGFPNPAQIARTLADSKDF
jgi:hypothetical protein